MTFRAGLLTVIFVMAAGWLLNVQAEYRAYELEIVDKIECRLNKRQTCERFRVNTALAPDSYARLHGGTSRLGVQMLATWICYGNTSSYKPVCSRPPARKPKFASGDNVKIRLERHITNGWVGQIEIVYFQPSISANVYGVRFSDRSNIYARYFEKDLQKAAAQPESAQ